MTRELAKAILTALTTTHGADVYTQEQIAAACTMAVWAIEALEEVTL